MTSLEESSKIVFENCMLLKPDESVLIIYDENTKEIAMALKDGAFKISQDVNVVEIPVGKTHGDEPPEEAAEMMKNTDVIVAPTTKSLTHTHATNEACTNGARVATMPMIVESIFTKLIPVDYEKMNELTKKFCELLDNGNKVRVVTEIGTDISMSIEGRKSKNDGGIFPKGKSGNLPAGESFIAPLEGTADGVFYIDASISNIEIKKPIKVKVEEGYAVSIEGDGEADRIREILDGKNDKNAFNIAELGIGANEKAEVVGNPLEDEKVLGTCHIAFGSNFAFGGEIKVPVHIDGILKDPTIYIDDVKIMESGKLLI